MGKVVMEVGTCKGAGEVVIWEMSDLEAIVTFRLEDCNDIQAPAQYNQPAKLK